MADSSKTTKTEAPEPTGAPAAASPAPEDEQAPSPREQKFNPTAGRPCIPCFDYNTKSKKPNLGRGEKIENEGEKKGVKFYFTNHGRKIYCCDLRTYEDVFETALIPFDDFAEWFPHAAPADYAQKKAARKKG